MYALMAVIFVAGYALIAFEHRIKIDKAASAILTAVLMWTVLVMGVDPAALPALRQHLGEIAEILFFLLAAMTIVELIDAHDGFKVMTDRITARNKVTLLWILGLMTFFLSALLDNLTTTIVMVTLLRKLIADREDRWLYTGIVVIAANAGGAWSPMGDVTTTMLWIGHQISSVNIMKQLFIPSLVCLLLPLLVLSRRLQGVVESPALIVDRNLAGKDPTTSFERHFIFCSGLGALLFVPVFKFFTHLPPYIGMLLGLGVLWVATEIIHASKNDEERRPLSVAGVIQRVDTTVLLFFLGILLAVASLATAGHLIQVATFLRSYLGNVYAINIVIGLLSAMMDNVPLVAGAMNMYPLISPEQLMAAPEQTNWLQHFVVDGHFWELLAYCAGTGGSCLIIGSAAGVAAMGLEKIDFFWYLKNIGGLALLGYFGGVLVYMWLVS